MDTSTLGTPRTPLQRLADGYYAVMLTGLTPHAHLNHGVFLAMVKHLLRTSDLLQALEVGAASASNGLLAMKPADWVPYLRAFCVNSTAVLRAFLGEYVDRRIECPRASAILDELIKLDFDRQS